MMVLAGVTILSVFWGRVTAADLGVKLGFTTRRTRDLLDRLWQQGEVKRAEHTWRGYAWYRTTPA